KVADQSETFGRRDLRCVARLAQAEQDLLLERVPAARQHLDEGYELARELNDEVATVRAAWSRADLAQADGDPGGAVEILRGAVALAQEIENDERILTSYM